MDIHPMLKLATLLLAMTLLTLSATPLLQTGQTLSYDYTNGTTVTDGSIKDDGYYRAGATRVYSRSMNIVTDSVTGLQWQDNESIKKPWVLQANYDAGKYNDTSDDTATTYCTNLELGVYSDWRLPSVEELFTLVDNSKYSPSVTEGVFEKIFMDDGYWTSTTTVNDIKIAWNISFGFGDSGYFTKKSEEQYVRCVRGEPLDAQDFSRDNISEVVTDNNTGLQWQDYTGLEDIKRSWMESLNYCEALTTGEESDWRLPNIKELLSIVNYSNYNPSIDSNIFHNTNANIYWSSTTFIYNESEALNVNFRSGNSAYSYYTKGSQYNVRCVRGGQVNSFETPTSITATDGTEPTINITWAAVTEAIYYELYRSESSSDIGNIVDVAHTNSFVDDMIAIDTLYYYRAKACDDTRCGDYSSADSGYIGNISQSINPSIIMYLLN